MKISLTPSVQETSWGQEVNQIFRACVHCGFCSAVCPTYQVLSNELDSPRGRIYLIKSFFEGHPVSTKTQYHLDLCLTCRSCETSCPSGVRYGKLIDVGRHMIEEQVKRPMLQRLQRWGLRTVVSYPYRFQTLLNIGQLAYPFLPKKLRPYFAKNVKLLTWPQVKHARTMGILNACVQPRLAPNINAATAQVLEHLEISSFAGTQKCCGALSYHLAAPKEGLTHARRLIDVWWPLIEEGKIETLVSTTSGCGVFIKEYGALLRDDPQYARKAAKVAELTQDISEVLAREDLSCFHSSHHPLPPIALHAPCTLQHGQKLGGMTASLLTGFGFSLTKVPDAHLCCGSAGVYSLLNQEIAQQLLVRKLTALSSGFPQWIVTANIGCQMHLQSRSEVPVKHWIELIAEYFLSSRSPSFERRERSLQVTCFDDPIKPDRSLRPIRFGL